MFTAEWREQLRVNLLEKAQSDSRISGGAITGSASIDQLDAWSDIDLAFGVSHASELRAVLDSFTEAMYSDYGAIHHLDVASGPWIYRVFLLSNTLQVDLAFVPEEHFGARAPTFKLIFGKTGGISHDPATPFDTYVGWCWLYALHVRSSLRRGKLWQAEFFISGMRNYLISLYCRRFGLPEKQGRGVDQLPPEQLKKLEATLVKSMEISSLKQAFSETIRLCLEEIEHGDQKLHAALKRALSELACP